MNNCIFCRPAIIKAKDFALITLILLIAFSCKVSAQLTQYSIGGPGNELATKIKYLPTDGSAIIAGYSYDITSGAATNCQAIIMKVTSTGTIAWQKTFGIPNTNNIIEDMTITEDNNIVVVGTVGGHGNAFANNTAAILKYNATTGNLMWQSCLNDAATTTGGELFYGVTELKDGTGRLVAVGSHNFTPDGAGSIICVFQSTGALIYNELYDIPNGDEFRGVTTSADGASVYICGEFVGSNYKDGKVISYTPGASSGTVNWTQCFDYAALGTMQNNFFGSIYLSGTKIIVTSGNIVDYTGAGGESNGVMTMNAADGSGAQIKIVQNSGMIYGNSSATAVVSADHIFFVQSPATVSYDATIVTPGATSSSVITEITSLASSTANTPVKFVSSDVGQHSVLDMNLQGSTLYLAGSTNVTNGFGNNDIYYVNTNTSLSSLNHSCDTAHDVVSITTPSFTNSTPTFTLSSFTPVYTTVDTGSTHFSIAALCGDIIQDTVCNTISLPDSTHGCTNTTVSLNTVVNGPDSVVIISWVPAQGLSNPNILNPICTIGASSVNYHLTVKSLLSNGDTCTATDSIYVAVIAPDTTHAGADTILCADASGAILTAHQGYTSYLWNNGDTTAAINVNATGYYWVTETDNCDLRVDTFHVTKLLRVQISATGDTTICSGDKAQLNATGAITYSWLPVSGLNNPLIANPVATANVPITYVVTGIDSNGCVGSDSIMVNALAAPALTIDSVGVITCDNSAVQLNATGAERYRWQPAQYCNNQDIPDPIVSPTSTTTFYLTGYDAAGCSATDSVQVLVVEGGDVVMPNAFTPNGDGINDIIFPITYCNFMFESFSIYNRWGQRVFFTNTYGDGWDGRFNGVPQPVDVFVYFVTGFNGLTKEHIMRKGNITLVR